MSTAIKDGFYTRADNYGLMEVYGADATRFLQAQTTNDINQLAEYSSQTSCLLDRKAHIEAYFQVYRKHHSYRLVAERPQIDHIMQHLELYKFADKVEFINLTEGGTFFAVEGPRARSVIDAGMLGTTRLEAFVHYLADLNLFHCAVHLFRKPLMGNEGYFLWVPNSDKEKLFAGLKKACKEFGVQYLSDEELELARIEIGVPKFGVDFDSSNFLPETGLETQSVSYTKGCFLGQEVLARVRSQGSPTKGLVGLLLPEGKRYELPLDTKIMTGDKQVAWIKSSCFSSSMNRTVAMAFVIRDLRVPDTSFTGTIDGDQVEFKVTTLPFYHPETSGTRARKLYEQALQIFAKEDELEHSKTDKEDSQSVSLLRQALELDPFLEDAYESLGVILSKRGHLPEAISLMKKLAELNPESVMAHTNLSVFYLEENNIELAEEEKAISMSIRMKIAAKLAMEETQDKKRHEEQKIEQMERLKMFEQVLQIDSEDLLANYGAGSCYEALGEFDKAIPLLKKAIEVKPTHTVAFLSLGVAYEGLGEFSKAAETYKEGISVASKRGDMQPMQDMQNRLGKIQAVKNS
jgi:folate-binding protein YgfZ